MALFLKEIRFILTLLLTLSRGRRMHWNTAHGDQENIDGQSTKSLCHITRFKRPR